MRTDDIDSCARMLNKAEREINIHNDQPGLKPWGDMNEDERQVLRADVEFILKRLGPADRHAIWTGLRIQHGWTDEFSHRIFGSHRLVGFDELPEWQRDLYVMTGRVVLVMAEALGMEPKSEG
jgi:hypothetical protein